MFLQQLAKHIVSKYGSDLSSFIFVFPNRRSGLFFKRYLLENTEGTSWAPAILTINELMQELGSLKLADPLDLLFAVYDSYSEIDPNPESFDDFYTWGEMMLSDFDNLDKYLVNPEEIFKNIRELKEIDEKFGGLEEEQVEFIRTFWKSFLQGDMTREKDVFLTTWHLLPKIYEKLKDRLNREGQAYEGMIYRQVAEMEATELSRRLNFDKYVFVGFNALSLAEKRLLHFLKNRNSAFFYWDYDRKYIDTDYMEAGRFLRENLKNFPPEDDLGVFDSFGKPGDIRIFDLPSDILQAKTVYNLLNESSKPIENANDTAIVACDENLLIPVLHSLPEQVNEVNVTMGYPFRNTPLNSFVESILKMILHARKNSTGEASYYHKDVLSVLNHQYYKLVSGSANEKLIKRIIKENRIYIGKNFFEEEKQSLFRSIRTVKHLCDYLNDLLQLLRNRLTGDGAASTQAIEGEYVHVLMTRLNKLSDRFINRPEMELTTFVRIFRKITANMRIPFTGEPLAGLQLMGILETRLLDFDHVVMLSVNEDVMPRASAGNSFIPYSLRYAFGLPVREDMDAIYAYYFYRVIQRAKKIDLIFNSSSEGVQSGEMSRYLYQLKFDYQVETFRPQLAIKSVEQHPVLVTKDAEIMALLDKYLQGSKENKYLSPSAINTYIECPLKFYLRYLAGVGESEDVLEELDAIGFGNILHDTMEQVYRPYADNNILLTGEELHKILDSDILDVTLLQEFRKEFYHSDKDRKLEGRNLIIYEILKKYARRILEIDIKLGSLNILQLEEEYRIPVKIRFKDRELELVLGGKIDRVDRPEGRNTRIIDYKTGNSHLDFASIDKLFDPSVAGRNKEAFQALTYSYIYRTIHDKLEVEPGLYVVRKLFDKEYNSNFKLGSGRQKEDLMSFSTLEEEFASHLISLLEEIYNTDIPFSQTEVTDRCVYCDFNELCHRR